MTSSYKNRQGLNPNKRYQQAIKDLESEKNAYIAESTGQLRDLQSENRRAAKLQDFVTNKELKDLSNLSDTFNNFLQKAVVPTTKRYWDGQIEKGRLAYKTRDQDPNQEFYKNEEEINKAIDKSRTLDTELAKRAKNLPTDTQKLELTGLSGFKALGYKLQRLDDAAVNFGEWRLNQLQTSTKEITVDGVTFQIKDAQPGVQYEAASDALYKDYVNQNRGDLSAKYVNTKFIPQLDKIEFAQKGEYNEKQRKLEASDQIDAGKVNLNLGLNSGDPTRMSESLINAWETLSTNFRIQGSSDPNTSTRQAIRDQIQTYIEENSDNTEKIQNLKNVLNTLKVPGHSNQKLSMAELYPKEFSDQTIDDIVSARNTTKFRQEQAKDQIILQGIRDTAIEHSLLDPNSEQAIAIREQYVIDNKLPPFKNAAQFKNHLIREYIAAGATLEQQASLLNELNKRHLNFQESVSHLERLAEKENGKISETIILQDPTVILNEEALKLFREKDILVDKTFASQTNPDAIKKAKESLSAIVAEQTLGLSRTNKQSTLNGALEVEQDMHEQLHTRAEELYKNAITNNAPISREQAYQDAVNLMNVEYRQINFGTDRQTDHNWFWDTGTNKGYTNMINRSFKETSAGMQKSINETNLWLLETPGPNVIENNLNPWLIDEHFKIRGGKINKVFYEMAKHPGTELTAYEIFNNQIEQFLLKKGASPGDIEKLKLELGEDGKLAKKIFYQAKPNVRRLTQEFQFNQRNSKVKTQLLTQAGVVDPKHFETTVNRLHESVVFKGDPKPLIQLINMFRYDKETIQTKLDEAREEATEIYENPTIQQIILYASAKLLNKPTSDKDVQTLARIYHSGGL